jgi:integrase
MLSDLACRNAAKKPKAYKLADGQGLYLFVTPTGFKSWRWKYRIGRKEKRLIIGPYPLVGLTAARKAREDAARLLHAGIDPAIAKKQRQAEQAEAGDRTFQSQAIDWIDSQRHRWTPSYADLVQRQFEKDVFPKFGSVPIGDVTTPMVLQALRPIEHRGARETAHRMRSRISEVYARAVAAGIATSDPAAVTRRAIGRPSKKRYAAVRSIDAAQGVLKAVEASAGYPVTRLASRLLALTVVRAGVLRMAEQHEFEDLDGAEPIWRIPAAKMKLVLERKEEAAMEFIVPLSRQAVATVKVAIAWSRGARYIFRGVLSAGRPISDNTLGKAYRDAGLGGFHVPHGWRSTFSTIMNEIAEANERDGDRAIIDLMLAHVPRGTEATYNRAAYMRRRREIAQDWADRLTQGLPGPEALLGAKPPP